MSTKPHHVRALLACMALAATAAGEMTYPPKLPDGKEIFTGTGPELLKPPESMKSVAVAKEAPTVDFLYYPGQTYAGKPWSNWGDGCAAGEKYYSAIGDHLAPAGNAFVYEYDAATKKLRMLAEVRKVLNLPDGHYAPGKIHSRVDLGEDGWLYYATHRGSTRVTTDQYHYQGDWILRTHPGTGRTEIVAHGPVGKQCIPCSVLDPKRLIFYGSTQAGDTKDKRNTFFAYDIKARKLLYQGYGGPGRYFLFARSTGRVYFTPDLEGTLFRYDPAAGGAPVELGVEMGLRAATQETPQGHIYAVSGKGGAELCRFDVRSEKVEPLGPAAVGSQSYITSLDADPTGRYLYYVPGAHGGSQRDGSAVVQFDVQTRTRKVVAFLHPFLKARCGFTPLGTFSTAVSPGGEELYITWQGCCAETPGRKLTWDACALTVIHIPASERKTKAE
ncbi:MAG TPA: hypothetical protein VM031_02485 [Phycisphaerae bacterium]|nr:hypothetical protein [Phycisphaerae bacterium]